jgi:hypothetical protein
MPPVAANRTNLSRTPLILIISIHLPLDFLLSEPAWKATYGPWKIFFWEWKMRMERWFRFLAIGTWVIFLFLPQCGKETTNIGSLDSGTQGFNGNPGGGIPGLAVGTLVDNTGGAIWGATVWIPSSGSLAHTEFDICPEPTGQVEHGGCTNVNGTYEIDCDAVGEFVINVMNHHGETLPAIFGNCGGSPQFHALNVGPQPHPGEDHDDDHGDDREEG